MSTQETAWQAGESAAAVLGPEADLLASADAAGLGASTLAVLRRAARKPGATGTAVLRYWTSLALAGPVAAARWLGVDTPPPVPVPAGDKRFAGPAWTYAAETWTSGSPLKRDIGTGPIRGARHENAHRGRGRDRDRVRRPYRGRGKPGLGAEPRAQDRRSGRARPVRPRCARRRARRCRSRGGAGRRRGLRRRPGRGPA